jgi:SAM-dependent methyltransferase
MTPVERPSWAPEGIDLNRPSAARVYDYYLGGFHNFEVDRTMAQQAIEMWPDLPAIMQANRAYLRRVVRYLVGEGMDQFLDLGSGIPTSANVHAVAHEDCPDARVVYVDADPVAVAHSRAILDGDPRTAVLQADLRDADAVLEHPELTGLLDLDRPVAVLMFAVLHFVEKTEQAVEAIERFRTRLAPGSFLAISHATHEGQPELSSTHQSLYRRTATPMTMRSRQEVATLFDGFTLADPGLVYMAQWRPDPGDDTSRPERFPAWVGVGRTG